MVRVVGGAVLLGVAGSGLWHCYSLGVSQRTLPGAEQLNRDVWGVGSGWSREDGRRVARGHLRGQTPALGCFGLDGDRACHFVPTVLLLLLKRLHHQRLSCHVGFGETRRGSGDVGARDQDVGHGGSWCEPGWRQQELGKRKRWRGGRRRGGERRRGGGRRSGKFTAADLLR